MSELKERVEKAVAFINARAGGDIRTGIVLGTGLGPLVKQLKDAVEIPYDEIPGFVQSTVKSHGGNLHIGTIHGVRVAMMEGRFHFYEGYSLDQVTFPVRALRGLGATSLVITNACGSLNPMHRMGDLMIIDDHINLMGVNPLIGPNDDALGPRFPDMCEPYKKEYADMAIAIARENGMPVHRGVYAAMTGPCLETRAEYRMLRIVGADAIGMSTVPEVIVAVHAGLKVLGVSVLTDVCLPDALEPCNIEQIIRVANQAEPLMVNTVLGFIKRAGEKGIL